MSALSYFLEFGQSPKTWSKFIGAIEHAYVENRPGIINSLKPLNVDEVGFFKWGDGPGQNGHFVFTEKSLLLLLPGLRTPSDAWNVFLKSNAVRCLSLPGYIVKYTQEVGTGMHDVIDLIIRDCAIYYLKNQVDVLFVGHSHGGSLCACYYADHAKPLPSSLGKANILSFSSPRVTDQTATNAMPVPRWNTWHLSDIVPAMPPMYWPNFVNPYDNFLGNADQYTRQGQSWIFNSNGDIVMTAENPQFPFEVVNIAVNGVYNALDISAHDSGNTARILSESEDYFTIEQSGESTLPILEEGFSMAIRSFRVIYYFTQGPYQWSESLNVYKNDMAAAVAAATNGPVLAARIAMLELSSGSNPFQPAMVQVKVVDLAAPSNPYYGNLTSASPPPTNVDGAEIPHTSLLIKLYTGGSPPVAPFFTRNLWMSGFPDDVLTAGGKYNGLATGFTTLMNTWVAAISAAGFTIHHKRRNAPWNAISGIANVPYSAGPPIVNPKVVITPAVAPVLPPGQGVIKVRGVTPAGIISGVYKVVVTGTTYEIPGVNYIGTIKYPGQVQEAFYDDDLITFGGVVRGTHRIRSAPTYGQKGRRRRPKKTSSI